MHRSAPDSFHPTGGCLLLLPGSLAEASPRGADAKRDSAGSGTSAEEMKIIPSFIHWVPVAQTVR